MDNLIYLIVFIIFSANSVVEDILKYRIRLHEIAFGIAIVLAIKAVLGDSEWIDTIVGGCVGSIVFIIVVRFSKGRLGAGDVWFSTLIGCTFGFWTWDISLAVAALLGGLWVGVLWLSGRHGSIRDIRIPFVPFMFAGAVAVALYRGLSQ